MPAARRITPKLGKRFPARGRASPAGGNGCLGEFPGQPQQNGIIKIFSVIAVVLMPPTLVASIYGMNFEHMPELKWLLGYPWALLLMLLSAVCPYLFFRWRGWL